MTTALWVVLVHVIELILIAGYLLVNKNNKLEKLLINQQQYIDNFSDSPFNLSHLIVSISHYTDNPILIEEDLVCGIFLFVLIFTNKNKILLVSFPVLC